MHRRISYTLDDAAKTHAEFPETFAIPLASDRGSLRVSDLAKLMFRLTDGREVWVERMWVQVEQVRPETYIGSLDNMPHRTDELELGARVEFNADHVIQIERASE